MNRSVIITNEGVREISDREFFAGVFGHAPKSREQRLAEHRANLERYIAMIDNGGGWGVPPPYLAECRRIIAEREAAECGPDPLRHLEPLRRRA